MLSLCWPKLGFGGCLEANPLLYLASQGAGLSKAGRGSPEKGQRGPPEGSRGARKGSPNGRDGHMQIQGARLVRVWYAFCGRWLGLKPKRPADSGQLGLEKKVLGGQNMIGGD